MTYQEISLYVELYPLIARHRHFNPRGLDRVETSGASNGVYDCFRSQNPLLAKFLLEDVPGLASTTCARESLSHPAL